MEFIRINFSADHIDTGEIIRPEPRVGQDDGGRPETGDGDHANSNTNSYSSNNSNSNNNNSGATSTLPRHGNVMAAPASPDAQAERGRLRTFSLIIAYIPAGRSGLTAGTGRLVCCVYVSIGDGVVIQRSRKLQNVWHGC